MASATPAQCTEGPPPPSWHFWRRRLPPCVPPPPSFAESALGRLLAKGVKGPFALFFALMVVYPLLLLPLKFFVDAISPPRGPLRVSELWVYPIKSCGGIQVATAEMHRGGLRWDREFAVVNAAGEVLSQKTYPRLAKICPTLHCAEADGTRGTLNAQGTRPGSVLTGLSLHAADDASSSVHVDLEHAQPIACATTWVGNSAPLDAEAFSAADGWLTGLMGFECRLVRLRSRRGLRTTRLAPVSDETIDCCRYQDGAPLTLLSEASVASLCRHYKRALPPARFRANVVVSGCRPLEEVTWTSVSVGPAESAGAPHSTRIRMLMEAYRCTMVTIAQAAEAPAVEAGSRPDGPLKLFKLMKQLYARDSASHGPLPRDNPNFAVFAAPDQDAATISVGDALRVCGAIQDAAPEPEKSQFAYNERRAPQAFKLNGDRFWDLLGPNLRRVDTP